MNTNVIKLDKEACGRNQVEFNLSFRPLLAYLKSRLKTERSLKSEFYRFLIEKIESYPILRAENIGVEEMANHKDTLELIFTILTPLMAKDDDLFWALSTPIPDSIFFSTDAFYNLFTASKAQSTEKKIETSEVKKLKFVYKLILERLYHFNSIIEDEIVYGHINPETKLTQYYNIQCDTEFIDIKHKGSLPELNFESLATDYREGDALNYLTSVLPLSDFIFEGFTVITLTNVTIPHAVAEIRNSLVGHNYQTETYNRIIQLLKTVGGNPDLEFGLMPFLTVNDKMVLDNQDFSQCMLINAARKAKLEEEAFYELIDKYKENPRSIFVNSIQDIPDSNDAFYRVLKSSGAASYAVIPVFYNNQLAGIIEIYSNEEFIVDDNLLSRLQFVLPLIGQLFQYSIEEFKNKLDSVLKDKFTALQPSVQWKFNEAVWNFIKNNRTGKKAVEIETVTFKNMYPLFGAIDIRNSTIERNIALRDDIHIQLNTLIETLTEVKRYSDLELVNKLLFNCRDWLHNISELATANDEALLNDFLAHEVYPFLHLVKASKPKSANVIDKYFECINPQDGLAFENRRLLEVSMQLINTEVSRFLDQAQTNLQASYPCYFGRFRTDGVEYDIYIGQEIAPDRKFDDLYLKNVRLWQLTSMVEIGRLTHDLICDMPRALETTQLIFVHSSPIDISFRNDERRFDVEGAYNIRYEVVKKRIDKVQVKNTSERLTQPHKIAMVYANADEAQEYLQYIKYLQVQGYLHDDLEWLELEALQGVAGLKALRVGIKYLR